MHGTCNKWTQRRLLLQVDLTFDMAIEVALAAEAADKDSRRLAAATADTNLLNDQQPLPRLRCTGWVSNVNSSTMAPSSRARPPCSQVVLSVTGVGGSSSVISAKRKGNLAKVCRRKNKYRTEQTNAVTAEETVTNRARNIRFSKSVQGQADLTRLHVVKANGNLLPMEINTGASVSVVGEKTLKTIQKGETTLELQQTSVRLQTYTGETIPVLGSVVVPVEHNGQTRTLPLIVTEGSGPSLLGRVWLSTFRLDWKAIFSVEATLAPARHTGAMCSNRAWESYGRSKRKSTLTRTNAYDSSNHVRFPS